MAFTWDSEHREFAETQIWAILATGRKDGSPQQSMIGYTIDDQGRLIMSVKHDRAKWKNVLRQPKVSLSVSSGRDCLIIYGSAETIAEDPLRAELTADVVAKLRGVERPDPTTLTEFLDEQKRTVLRITPTKTIFHN
jgi:PPOX class probable F420-dependent enzyme